MTILQIQPLSREPFAPFGDVIETEGATSFAINEGTAIRFHDLCRVDVGTESGYPQLSVFRAQPFTLPITLRLMERHPLGSQAFVPISKRPFAIVVCRPEDPLIAENLRAFASTGAQGVNYARNVWHHPLIALEEVSDFVIVDRGGGGENLEEVSIEDQKIELSF